ncbi:hypothetical protein KBD71_02515 [Candidatus Woesebacteria bacterium]|nr:hypothetical protein [Candidatus Woesebacteria bacterium]
MRNTKSWLVVLLFWLLEHGIGIPMLATLGVPMKRLDRFPWAWIVGSLLNDLLGGYRVGSTLLVLALSLFLKPLQKTITGIILRALCISVLVAILSLLSGHFNLVSVALFLAVSIGGPLWAGKRTASLIEIG